MTGLVGSRGLRFATALMLSALLAGCAGGGMMSPAGFGGSSANYAALNDGAHSLPAIDVSGINPAMLRQRVDYRTREPVGTVVVDTAARHLYLVEGDGKAMRYGIGVGKAGLAFAGSATIKRKAEWPHWSPTENMMNREPARYRHLAGGMVGGLENPLGPRAMYLYQGDRDTMFRIHGTTEPETIGTAVSSGCIRLMNQDVIDLYNRVKIGSRVVVIQSGRAAES
ncbi:L,D-transpeptidase [Tardiphaga alba]|uniref:L,D-transpeptidase n=2 Tax=Tardiphaga alba TaxID=340268 RepID=A0ABX8AEN7_9BRAD|nr:L,D-transpeptidase [Tardiphaga alba]QUS41737.1 L,D-transpeptidase [Tardiphaga alba]